AAPAREPLLGRLGLAGAGGLGLVLGLALRGAARDSPVRDGSGLQLPNLRVGPLRQPAVEGEHDEDVRYHCLRLRRVAARLPSTGGLLIRSHSRLPSATLPRCRSTAIASSRWVCTRSSSRSPGLAQ